MYLARPAITVCTKHENGDVDTVLDGDLDGFIRAYLIARRDSQVVAPPAGAEGADTDG